MDHNEVIVIIETIRKEEQAMYTRIKELNHAMFKHAVEFPTYEELYKFVSKQSKGVDDFNVSMLFCREEWLKRNS